MTNLDIVMAAEARSFLGKMPEGLQTMQADAVRRAVGGDFFALEQVRASRNAVPELPDGVSAEYVAPRMRLYRPSVAGHNTEVLPLLIYLHGGGWTFGSIGSCARFCFDMVAGGGLMVLALDYRLAPEHPYPAPLDDCIEAWEYVCDHACEWGADLGRISVGGDSSGGNLALSAAMRLNQASSGVLKVRSMVLFYPVTKAFCDNSPSWKEYGDAFGLDSDLMEAFNMAYLSGGACEDDSFVSPGCAPDMALHSLPPSLIISAGKDILRDQGREFAGRLCRLGADVRHIVFSEAVHLFITVEGQPSARAEAVRLSREFLGVQTGRG